MTILDAAQTVILKMQKLLLNITLGLIVTEQLFLTSETKTWKTTGKLLVLTDL
jgi:hypothetical protein